MAHTNINGKICYLEMPADGSRQSILGCTGYPDAALEHGTLVVQVDPDPKRRRCRIGGGLAHWIRRRSTLEPWMTGSPSGRPAPGGSGQEDEMTLGWEVGAGLRSCAPVRPGPGTVIRLGARGAPR